MNEPKCCDWCNEPHTRKGYYCKEACRKAAWEAKHSHPKRERRASPPLPYRKAAEDWPQRRARILAKYGTTARAGRESEAK